MTSDSEYGNDTPPLPLWTRILPWIVLISSVIALILVVQKGCIENSSTDIHGGANSNEPAYASQGVIDLEEALTDSTPQENEYVLDGITFIQGSARLNPASDPAMEQLLALLKKFQSVHIRLEGYCVQQQSTKANLKISHQRVVTVADYLKDHGISADRLRTVGRGASRRRTTGTATQNIPQGEFIGLVVESR